MSVSDYAENAILDALFNNTALQKANRYVKLHLDDPGEAGTANAATETTRKSVTGAAAVGGVFTSTNALTWAAYPATEYVPYISIWDHVSAGNCLWTGALVSGINVTSGTSFVIAAGALTVTVA